MSVVPVLSSFSSLQYVKYKENHWLWPKLNLFGDLKIPCKKISIVINHQKYKQQCFSIPSSQFFWFWARLEASNMSNIIINTDFGQNWPLFGALQFPAWRTVISKTIKIVKDGFLVCHSFSCSGFNVNQSLTIRQIWRKKLILAQIEHFLDPLTPRMGVRLPQTIKMIKKVS